MGSPAIGTNLLYACRQILGGGWAFRLDHVLQKRKQVGAFTEVEITILSAVLPHGRKLHVHAVPAFAVLLPSLPPISSATLLLLRAYHSRMDNPNFLTRLNLNRHDHAT